MTFNWTTNINYITTHYIISDRPNNPHLITYSLTSCTAAQKLSFSLQDVQPLISEITLNDTSQQTTNTSSTKFIVATAIILCSYLIAVIPFFRFKCYSTFDVIEVIEGTPVTLDSKCVLLTSVPPVASLPLATPNINSSSSVCNSAFKWRPSI
jgi:hypothetical protein